MALAVVHTLKSQVKGGMHYVPNKLDHCTSSLTASTLIKFPCFKLDCSGPFLPLKTLALRKTLNINQRVTRR